MEFGSAVLNTIWAYYTAPDAAALEARREELRVKFEQVEKVLSEGGPWFAGEHFGLVDAVFGPVFRYFGTFEAAGETGFFEGVPKVRAWRDALGRRPSVRQAVSPEYSRLLRQFVLERRSELSRRLESDFQSYGYY